MGLKHAWPLPSACIQRGLSLWLIVILTIFRYIFCPFNNRLMKINQIVLLVFLLTAASFPQVIDSTGADTLRFDDSTAVILPDSAAADTSALLKVDTLFADTLKPLYSGPLSDQSTFISAYDIRMTDYENLSDILNLLPVSFINTTGQYGYPESIFLYGMLPGLMMDKVRANNTSYFTYNLNLVQTELIDSVEIIPAPRGFLYSDAGEPAAINLIEKDFISPVPYTRIKYYEGPYGQAFFDGIASTMIFNRLNFFLDVTNRKGDDSYANSAYSNWQATVKLKYYLSGKVNITGSYNYIKTESGYNGGVNVDSVYNNSSTMDEFKDLFYDEIQAYVNSGTASHSTEQHNFKIKSIWQPSPEWKTNVTLYSFFNEDKLTDIIGDSLGFKTKDYYYGAAADQVYHGHGFDINLSANYFIRESKENTVQNGNEPVNINNSRGTFISLAPSASFYFLDSTLIPSVFIKYTSFNYRGSESFAGYGFDVACKLDKFKFYAGASVFDVYLSNKNTRSAEAGVKYNNDNFNCDINIFSFSDNVYSFGIGHAGISGVGIKFNYLAWKILFENNSYYYFSGDRDFIPGYKVNTGVYFKSILFDEHLDLKTGFALSLMPGDYLEDSFEGPAASLFNTINYKLDFTLAGIVSKVATIYFTWENLTNNRYFIVPFYPMPERNIRFGLSWELFN
jgi:hypothetical protein